jgi:hypothetical protein
VERLLSPSQPPGSLYRCGVSTQKVANDPEYVSHGKREGTRSQLPEQYLLSKSNDHVRVLGFASSSSPSSFIHSFIHVLTHYVQIKYLLVLSEGRKPKATVARPRRVSNSTLLIILFVLLLAFMAFLRSPTWKRLRNKWVGHY